MVNSYYKGLRTISHVSLSYGSELYVASSVATLGCSTTAEKGSFASLMAWRREGDTIIVRALSPSLQVRKKDAWCTLSIGNPVTIQPWSLLRYNNQYFVVTPDDWLTFANNGVFFCAPFTNELLLSEMYCNDRLFEIIHCLNFTSDTSEKMKIWLQITNVSHPLYIDVPEIAGETQTDITTSRLAFNLAGEKGGNHESDQYLNVGYAGVIIASRPIRIIPPCYVRVSVTSNNEELAGIAAHIKPNSLAVETLIDTFIREQEEKTPYANIRYLYTYFSRYYDYYYHPPTTDGATGSLQRIVDIETVLESRVCACSCIESTILIASCIENSRMQSSPLLIFTGQQNMRMYHLLLGIYKYSLPITPRVILQKEDIVALINENHMLCIETTGFLANRENNNAKLDFDAAVLKGRSVVEASHSCIGFDIKELRHRRVKPIIPLETMLLSDEAGRICIKALKLRFDSGNRMLELSHLFGACMSNGTILHKAMCNKFGVSGTEQIVGNYAKTLTVGHVDADSNYVTTDTYREARQKAVIVAERRRSKIVSESDLLLAILEVSKKSLVMRRRCQKAGFLINPEMVDSLKNSVLELVGPSSNHEVNLVVVTDG